MSQQLESLQRKIPSPKSFFLKTLGTFLIGYTVIFFIKASFHEEIGDLLINASLLIPTLYVFTYRPMTRCINELTRQEAELSQAKALLETRVQERTAELAKVYKLLEQEYVEALRLSEENYKNVVESLGVGVSVISSDMELLSANSQIKNFLPGLDLSQKTLCYKAKSPVRDKVCDNCPTVKTLRDGQIHDVVETVVINGQRRTVRKISAPIRDPDGKIIAATEVVEDITERQREVDQIKLLNRRLEQHVQENKVQLTAAENRYRSLIKHSSEGILIFDPYTRKIQEANDRLLSMLGYTEQEITSLKIEDLFSANVEAVKDTVQNILDKGELFYVKDRCKGKNGLLVDIEASAAIIEYAHSKVCLVTIRDVTEQKRASQALQQGYANLKKTLDATVNALVAVAEKRDPYTAGHQYRVARLACAIARELGLSEKQVEGILISGTLHDIGKIYVPTDILNKPGKLTDMELALIKAHPQVSHEIIAKIPFEQPVADIVLQHHERFDGSGYPQGLSGENILLEARILGVADVVEAMASHRPYRPAIGLKRALEEINQHRGTLYDPVVVDTCLRLFKNGFDLESIAKNSA